MKLKSTSAALATIAVLVFAMSCATAPKAVQAPAPSPAAAAPAPAQAEAAPAEQAKPEAPAPDDLRSKAADLRKKAFDLGLNEILPDDYAAAEKAFADGNAGYGKDNEASAASYTDAASRFQDVIAKGMPILAENEKKRASDLRAIAVGKRSGELFPELFAYAEAEFAKPSDAEAAGDFEAAINGFRASSKNFEVLYKLCDANAARDSIVTHDLAKWDPSNWTLAETRFKASQDLFRQDSSAAATSVDEAIQRYGMASRTALEYYASDRKKNSMAEMDRAEGIKSEVAVKDEYAAALALYTQAETSQAAKDYNSSSSLYDRAATAFASAYKHAKVKMDTAKSELDSLDSAIAAQEAAAGAAQ
jgi:hypothetical protein